MNNLKIELHVLQNFPPSCLNRDDTNTPKTCEFGGYTRARVSSQCWKRAIREQFRATAPERTGTRSKRLRDELVAALAERGNGDTEALNGPVTKFLTTFYAGPDKKRPEETNVLVFYSPAEFATMVEILSEPGMLAELSKEAPGFKKADIERRLKASALSPDVALFARMLADAPGLNVEGSCQVAHAISTHAVNLELDFFTAVDDLKDTNEADDAGAGMLGTVGYDSACYYRYALVDAVQLLANLSGSVADADASLRAFLEAFCEAIPVAKKNSFAHGNPPFFAFFVVRSGGTPSSLVNAFARPVDTRQGDLLENSARALASYAGRLQSTYGTYDAGTVKTFLCHLLDDPDLARLPAGDPVSMRAAIDGAMAAVREYREAQA
ncbi:MAG TPA: type I-E CRISPR-associated protein Cas7/Cse4/CasC [Chthonomonadaceae bacterium]|nr:type I-E CRISPR-associated protein Cas7/Cse4/CasC [Chthonomonadaceae bacterium]